MPCIHKVSPGECLLSIARRYGFKDYKPIYDHPSNKAFREKRPNPNLLFPGDEIAIPDRKPKTEWCTTGTHHRIIAELPKRTLRLRLQDAAGKPLANVPYRLMVGPLIVEGTSGRNGDLQKEIPATASRATLEVRDMRWELAIGDLNPMRNAPDNGVSGVQARLANLGYAVGSIDGRYGPRTAAAIRAFQKDRGLQPSGLVDSSLFEALEKQYGC